MEPLVVGYNRTGLRLFVQSSLFAVALGIGCFAFAFLAIPTGPLRFLLGILGLVVMALGFLLLLQGFGRKGPALVIGSEGILVGFLAGSPILLPWGEVAELSTYTRVINGRSMAYLTVHVRDEPAFMARLGAFEKLNAWLAVQTGHPIVAIGLPLLDQPWEEIHAAATMLAGEGESEELDNFEALYEMVKKALHEEGRPENVEDFRRVFREGPIGHWDTSEYSVSPADSAVSFFPDGTAWSSSGGPRLLGDGEEFFWRPAGDFQIEVRTDQEEDWNPVGFLFSEFEGKVVLHFDEEPDITHWTANVMHDLYPYAGPIRNWKA